MSTLLLCTRRFASSALSPATLSLLQEVIDCRAIHTTAICSTFWEKEKKSGYNTTITPPSKKQLILDGLRELKEEVKLWRDEMKEQLEGDPILIFRPGETDVVFDFKAENALDKWVVTTDADHNEGKSTAALELSASGAGLFHGHVNSEHVKDGIIKRTGYANVRTKRVRRSFKRESTYDWTQYNTLIIKVRGDGRNYLINVHTEGYFDLQWNDVYHYVLYTRGGPHWQIAKNAISRLKEGLQLVAYPESVKYPKYESSTKIPFSKFFLSSKGRIQDKQSPIALNRVTHFGFSVGAKNYMDGPFRLEIDYVGLEYDPNHREKFAYEMYKTDKYIVAT